MAGLRPLLVLAALVAVPPVSAAQDPPPAQVAPAAPSRPAPATTPPAVARVTYLTAATAYVDAGRQDGLREGDTIQVVRDGQTIAVLKVNYVSAERAACSIVSRTGDLQVGDTAQFTPRPPSPGDGAGAAGAGVTTGTAAGPPPARRGPAAWGLRGRVGARYLEVRDRSGNGAGFSEPALDLWMIGTGVGGSTVDLAVDVRARRTSTTLTSGATEDSDLNQVYRLSASYRFDGGRRITLGRQYAPALSVVSIFDGVLYDANSARYGWGGFAGVQPDAEDFGFAGDVQEFGGYYQWRSLADREKRWALTTGVIGSYEEQEVNREFLYLQFQYTGRRLTAFGTQEIDYNRDWKVDVAGEDTIEPTSTFASLHFRAGETVTFRAGYDNRRRVRLYRDRVTPVTQFDDSYRQGGWVGADFRLGDHMAIGGDARIAQGGPVGEADGYSARLGWDRLTRHNLSIRARTTRFTNDTSEGWLHAVTTGLDFGSRAHLELAGGVIEETYDLDPTLDTDTTWMAIDLDLILGRRWYLQISGESNRSDNADNDQFYTSLTWRF
jgi:hypothetical protein